MSFLPSKTNARKHCALSCVIASIFFIACQPAQQQSIINKYLNANNLKTQFATINIHRDTMLKLAGGTEVVIPKDAIKTEQDTLQLTFKEALTPTDILLAGLFTQSNGKALQSDGMIYIAPAAGVSASIVQPIQVKIPSKDADNKMQLFKGQQTDSGINWIEPKSAIIKRDSSYEAGKNLFAANCASCHDPYKDATGPSLYKVSERWNSKEEMYHFVWNSAEMIASGHHYANCVYDKWNKTAMTPFPNLTVKELDAIFLYAEREGRRPQANATKLSSYGHNDCLQLLMKAKQKQIELEAHENSRESFATLKDTIRSMQADFITQVAREEMVKKSYEPADYYDVNIDAFGWYNIDGFTENDPGFKQCELSVSINRPEDVKADVFLFVPSVKMSGRGGLMDDGAHYGFFLANGKAPLPIGVQAYVIAVGESREKAQLYFAVQPFIISAKQDFTLNLQPTDSTNMLQRMRSLQLENVRFNVKEDTAAVNSHLAQKSLDSLTAEIQKNCDCWDIR